MSSTVPDFVLHGLDRFEVERRLGHGGFGDVYKAWDLERQATVALKLLRQYDPQAHLQLAGEFSRVRSIRHENLVQLHELLYVRRRPVLVMEFLPDAVSFPSGVRDDVWETSDDVAMDITTIAATRRALVEGDTQEGPFGERLPDQDWKRFGKAALGLLRGLSALHQRGLVHRDIKPSNVVVSAGRTVLLDYGLTIDDGGELLELAGTAGYMAPELFAHSRPTISCDIYSVGMLFLRSLIGRLPTQKERNDASKLRETIQAPQEYATFAELLIHGIETDPDRRPEISDFILELERVHVEERETFNELVVDGQTHASNVALIRDRLLGGLTILHGPGGSGRTRVAQALAEEIRHDHNDKDLIRLDANVEGFEFLALRLVQAGAERLMSFKSHEDLPVRALRLSNQLALRYPIIEAALENLGMPRVLGMDDSSTGQSTEEPHLLAQWLRALYAERTWVLFVEHLDFADLRYESFFRSIFKRGEFPACAGALVTCEIQPGGLEDIEPVYNLPCRPMSREELARFTRKILSERTVVDLENIVESLATLTRGYPGPCGEILYGLPEHSELPAETTTAMEDGIRRWTSFAVQSWTRGLSAQSIMLLWIISAARAPFAESWIRALCGQQSETFIRELRTSHLVRRKVRAGEAHYVPYTRALADVICASPGPDLRHMEPLSDFLSQLENQGIRAAHAVARMRLELGFQAEAAEGFRGVIRMLLRARRDEDALRVAEEFLSFSSLEDRDLQVIASVFIHCRRPLDAATILESRFPERQWVLDFTRKLRSDAGDRRENCTQFNQSSEPQTRRRSKKWSIRNLLNRNTDRGGLEFLQRIRRSGFTPKSSLTADFPDVHPTVRPAYEAFRTSNFRRCLEILARDVETEVDDVTRLPSVLRLRDYMSARSQFFLCRPVGGFVIVAPEGSQPFDENEGFQTACSYLTVGWLLGIQKGNVTEVLERVESAARIVETFEAKWDLGRLVAEARSMRRIRDGASCATDIVPWTSFSSQIAEGYAREFFKARNQGNDHIAREILRSGFRQSYHAGTTLLAAVLLMNFGEIREERVRAEETLRKSGWLDPTLAACMVFGISRNELAEIRSALPNIEGIRYPTEGAFQLHSFV